MQAPSGGGSLRGGKSVSIVGKIGSSTPASYPLLLLLLILVSATFHPLPAPYLLRRCSSKIVAVTLNGGSVVSGRRRVKTIDRHRSELGADTLQRRRRVNFKVVLRNCSSCKRSSSSMSSMRVACSSSRPVVCYSFNATARTYTAARFR